MIVAVFGAFIGGGCLRCGWVAVLVWCLLGLLG